MQVSQQPALAHVQVMSDSAVDAAWTAMLPGLGLENRRLLPVVVGAHRRGERLRAEICACCGEIRVFQ